MFKMSLADSFFMERKILYMRLKKIFCSLMSVGISVGLLGGFAGAETMNKILKKGQFQENLLTVEYVNSFQKFIKDEKEEMLLRGSYGLENIQRMDSLVFWCFCGFCNKTIGKVRDGDRYLKTVVGYRNPSERRRDMNILQDILPKVVDKLKNCFGLEVCENELKTLREEILRFKVAECERLARGIDPVDSRTARGQGKLTVKQSREEFGRKRLRGFDIY